MKRYVAMFVIVVVALVLAGCREPAQDASPRGAGDADALEAAAAGFFDKLNAGDTAGVAEYYAEDATIYPPHAEPISGRAAIQAFWDGFVADGSTGDIELESSSASGTLGARIGGFKIMDASSNIVDEGHFIEVWALGDDGWKIVDDIWNSDWPLEPPPV